MFLATINGADIRKCEHKTGKNGGEYLLVKFEDADANTATIVDKNVDREGVYERGAILNLTISIDIGRQFTNIRIEDATPTA